MYLLNEFKRKSYQRYLKSSAAKGNAESIKVLTAQKDAHRMSNKGVNKLWYEPQSAVRGNNTNRYDLDDNIRSSLRKKYKDNKVSGLDLGFQKEYRANVLGDRETRLGKSTKKISEYLPEDTKAVINELRTKSKNNKLSIIPKTSKSKIKTKLLTGKKLAVGVIATGLGLAAINKLRKSRNDKNKKRGKYRKLKF